jgi:hypothetical protein
VERIMSTANKATLFGIGTTIVTVGLKILDSSSEILMKALGIVLIAIGSGVSVYSVQKMIEQGVASGISKAKGG